MKVLIVSLVLVAGTTALAQPHRPSWEIEREAKEFSPDTSEACASLIRAVRDAGNGAICPADSPQDTEALASARRQLRDCQLPVGRAEKLRPLIVELEACDQGVTTRRQERAANASTRPIADIERIPARYRLPQEQLRLNPAKPTLKLEPTDRTEKPFVDPPPPNMKPITFLSGVYAGSFNRTDRIKGQKGCKWIAERRLTMTIEANGALSWTGYSFENIECPREHSIPASCWYDGTGALGRDKKGWILQAQTTGIAPGPVAVEGTGRRVWKCGAIEVVLPDGMTPSKKSCVALGPEEDSRMLVAADMVCKQGGNPWDDLANVRITMKGSTLTIPVMGKSKLKITRVSDLQSLSPEAAP